MRKSVGKMSSASLGSMKTRAAMRSQRTGGNSERGPRALRLRLRAVPTRLRASGFGWSSTISRIGAGFVPLIFGSPLWPYLGLPMTLAVIGVLATLAALWMALAALRPRAVTSMR
jgi:hypothetical protein